MQQVIESVSDPCDHLALDEALLLSAEADELGETIRVWQFARPTVVVGRSSKVEHEVNRAFCERESIPIFRRCTGGATIVGGPGCLMYSVVLNMRDRPELRKIDAAHRYVMHRILAATQQQIATAVLQGICDLTLGNRKFSGNSLRLGRDCLLYHGTILHDSDAELIANCLAEAPRQPEYRAARGHRDFVTNVEIDIDQFEADLLRQFAVRSPALSELPRSRMRDLRSQRYENHQWNYRH